MPCRSSSPRRSRPPSTHRQVPTTVDGAAARSSLGADAAHDPDRTPGPGRGRLAGRDAASGGRAPRCPRGAGGAAAAPARARQHGAHAVGARRGARGRAPAVGRLPVVARRPLTKRGRSPWHDRRVPWRFTDDVEAYAERVGALLSADPARNTIALTVLGMIRAGHRYSDDPMLFGWYEGGDGIHGAVFHTPPFYLELAVVPGAATHDLVRALRAAGRAVTGINGDGAAVERFAAAWTAETGERARTEFRLCLHELAALRPPEPAPAGAARPARDADVERAAGCYHAFQEETGTPGGAGRRGDD